MAAGIGEASAILTVAQLGISLSKSLITYIEEVKGAPAHIQRIGNEILTTSERLKDIGELVSQNSQTKVFNEEGINSAVRCSTECQQIIQDLRIVLCKGGWQDHPKESDKDVVDTSLFSTLRWPFIKIKLEVPRAELHRIKIDLSLLFSAAMVLKASTTVEKQRIAQDIPSLHKARAWAAKRTEQAKEMAQDRPRISKVRGAPWSDDEPEMLEEFLTFKEKLFREEEEKRIRERAIIIQAEDDAKKRREEDAQREVERKAVEEYKNKQQEQEARSAEKKENFRNELERLGLESAQIQVVMESSNLDFQAASGTATVPEVRPSFSPGELSGELETTPSATSGRSRLSLPWWRSKKSTRESSPVPSLNLMLSESSTGPSAKLQIETWLIDVYSHRRMEILPSADWLIAKMKKVKKDQNVWNRFANLRPHWRNAILEFLQFRNLRENPEWTLHHLWVPQKWSRTRLLGQRRDEQLIQLLLSRRRANDEDADMPRVRPKSEGPGNSLPKRVSFAGELEKESGTEKEVNAASENAPPRNDLSMREFIARLEERRNSLGVHNQEEISDLNDMITYLRNQIKSDATHTSALNTRTSRDGHLPSPQPEPQTASVRSGILQEPTIVYEERIPNDSRGDFYIDRSSSPSPRTSGATRRMRSNDADDIATTSHHPRVTEFTEIDSSPGKTDYDGRPVVWEERWRMPEREPEFPREDYGVGPLALREETRERPRERPRRSEVEADEIIEIRRPRENETSREADILDDEIIIKRRERGWPKRPVSRFRPSRQDSSGTRGGAVIVETRERSHERSKPRAPRPSRQPSSEIDYYDHFDRYERGMVGGDHIKRRERTREREEAWSPDRRDIVIRRSGRSRSRPHVGQNSLRSGSEDSYTEGESGQSKALVLRAGASGLSYDYVRERVLNGGIRVRGDDDVGSPRPEDASSRLYMPPSRAPTLRSSYRDRSWAPSLRRRLSEPSHHFESSEDDEYRYRDMKRVSSEKKGSEAGLSDADVIAQTLKKYTTIQDIDMPTTGIAAPLAPRRRPSETEVGPSVLKNVSHESSAPERKKSVPVPGRKAHFEQENGLPSPDQEGQSRATDGDLKDDGPFLEKISEEPYIMIEEDDDIPQHQRVIVPFPERPVLPHPQQRPSFSFPPDLTHHHSRDASPRAQSCESSLDSPRTGRANGRIILEHGGFILSPQGEVTGHAAEDEGNDEVEDSTRQISRNPTVQEEID